MSNKEKIQIAVICGDSEQYLYQNAIKDEQGKSFKNCDVVYNFFKDSAEFFNFLGIEKIIPEENTFRFEFSKKGFNPNGVKAIITKKDFDINNIYGGGGGALSLIYLASKQAGVPSPKFFSSSRIENSLNAYSVSDGIQVDTRLEGLKQTFPERFVLALKNILSDLGSETIKNLGRKKAVNPSNFVLKNLLPLIR